MGSQVDDKVVSMWMRDAALFRSVVANVPGIVYCSECREPWRMFYVSDYVEVLLGYRPADFLEDATVTFGDLLHPDDHDRITAALDDVLQSESSYVIEYRLLRADGSVAWVEEHGSVIREDDGTPVWLDGVIFNVSRRKAAEEARDRAEAELRYQALHDPLTGLPNRTLVLERAQQLLASAETAAEVAVLFIDLDDFKRINDELGHRAGDELLQRAAERLMRTVRVSDTIGRVGGDEFIVILEGHSVAKRATEIARRVKEVLDVPFLLDDHPDTPLTVSASIGIVVGGAGTADALLDDADVALYRAKAVGKGSHVVFRPEMRGARLRVAT
jgi:diguanylate cyclase (GGDEF)-like protein/PAS domain S-box-containing protein